MRGEQQSELFDEVITKGSPPLARGTASEAKKEWKRIGITPACAGTRTCCEKRPRSPRDHPRLRGEQIDVIDAYYLIWGSPPLARGTGSAKCAIILRKGITPACAGNRFSWPSCGPRERDHPRLRGEQEEATISFGRREGSPPLARGTDYQHILAVIVGGITPACAGNSYRIQHGRFSLGDHPRLRGEQTKKRLVVSCILQYRFSFFNQFFVDMFC